MSTILLLLRRVGAFVQSFIRPARAAVSPVITTVKLEVPLDFAVAPAPSTILLDVPLDVEIDQPNTSVMIIPRALLGGQEVP